MPASKQLTTDQNDICKVVPRQVFITFCNLLISSVLVVSNQCVDLNSNPSWTERLQAFLKSLNKLDTPFHFSKLHQFKAF